MNIKQHQGKKHLIAEVQADGILINTAEDNLDLLGNIAYQGYDHMIIHSKNLNPAFFDLKNKLAGEILQKYATYRMRLVILGDFSGYESQSLKDFIYESNKGRQVNFLTTTEEAIAALDQ